MLPDPAPFQLPPEHIIEVDGDHLAAITLPDDGMAVPIRVMCEALDLDTATQVDNINNDPVLVRGVRMVSVTISGRVRTVPALIHTMIPFWLAKIPANQVRADRRPKLIRYQEEIANILSQLFYGTDALAVADSSDPAIMALRQRMTDLLCEVRVARELLLAAQQQFMSQLSGQQEQLATQQQSLTALTEIVTELQDIIPVLPAQAAYIQRAIKQLAHRASQQRSRSARGQQSEDNLYQLLFGQFKADFNLPRYDALPSRRYGDALAWLQLQAATLLPDDSAALPPHQDQLL